MNNIYKYIDEYGNLTFNDKKVNEVDILIFTQILYIDFKDVIFDNGIKLIEAWNNAKVNNKIPRGLVQKNSIKLLEKLIKTERYKDLILKNYEYHLGDDFQFGAITIVVPNDCYYVCFEGTDDAISGWKEDFKLSYHYPVKAQKMASKYLNKIIKLKTPKVVVCGHSKGGNLSLVASMNINIIKKSKISSIYSFDGPGLRKKEFRSLRYKMIKQRLINIIPNQSIIGILLEQENMRVVKSKGFGIFQHDVMNWIVENDKFKYTKQDKVSKQLDKSINRWLEKHNYQERERIIEGIFSIFEKSGIKSTHDIKTHKLKSFYTLVKSSIDMDKETKNVIFDSIKLLASDFGSDIVNDSKKIVSKNIDKHFRKKKTNNMVIK